MPQPTAFWNKIADKYAQQPIKDQASYQGSLARVKHWLSEDMSVLELGCGTGSTAVLLAPSVKRYLGTDFASDMIRIANDKSTDIANLTFETSDAAQAGGIAQYDAVLGFNLFHLVPNPQDVLAQIHTQLHSEGLFISKTPCLGHKFYFAPLIKAMQLIGKAPKPVHSFKQSTWEQMIQKAGFEILETGGYPASLPNQLVVARKV
ncbi:MAG: class I SAM-dependent methyltransferase [Pelagimonas sp.]|jgi:2-polyprenyl-3-methyl-5-hydroxy-6-metoxy-1,4-benzoquinol methylase|nr:class I SAM-dependent methyltransferase [Pelagimonas sp.]